jgi:hypothetical protein
LMTPSSRNKPEVNRWDRSPASISSAAAGIRSTTNAIVRSKVGEAARRILSDSDTALTI